MGMQELTCEALYTRRYAQHLRSESMVSPLWWHRSELFFRGMARKP
jgi:hypothetical protein